MDITPEPELRGVDRIVSFMREHQSGVPSIEEAADAVATYNKHRPRPKDVNGLRKNLRERSNGRFYWHWDPLITDEAPAVHHAEVQKASQTLADLENMPVLLIRGLSSDVVSDESVAAFRDNLPRLQVYDVAGAGHMVAGDKNDAFNDGISKFISQIFD